MPLRGRPSYRRCGDKAEPGLSAAWTLRWMRRVGGSSTAPKPSVGFLPSILPLPLAEQLQGHRDACANTTKTRAQLILVQSSSPGCSHGSRFSNQPSQPQLWGRARDSSEQRPQGDSDPLPSQPFSRPSGLWMDGTASHQDTRPPTTNIGSERRKRGALGQAHPSTTPPRGTTTHFPL